MHWFLAIIIGFILLAVYSYTFSLNIPTHLITVYVWFDPSKFRWFVMLLEIYIF